RVPISISWVAGNVFKDFLLRLETRAAKGFVPAGFATAVIFRAGFGPSRPNRKGQAEGIRGYRVLTIRPKAGELQIDEHPRARIQEVHLGPGQWFTLEVLAEGNHLTVKVNGTKTAEFTDETRCYTSGHIVLQHGPKAMIEFRKIEVKELPAEKTRIPRQKPG